jgi:hypothetical protein
VESWLACHMMHIVVQYFVRDVHKVMTCTILLSFSFAGADRMVTVKMLCAEGFLQYCRCVSVAHWCLDGS